MTLDARITALAQAVGADIKALLGRSPVFGVGAPDARVTVVGAAQATGYTLLVPFTVAAGDTVIVGYKSEGSITSSTCSDSAGSTYTFVTSLTDVANNAAMYTAVATLSSEALTVTISSPGNDFDKLVVLVVRGATGSVLSTASLFEPAEAALNRLAVTVSAPRSFHVLLWAGYRNANVVAVQEPFRIHAQGNGAGAIAIASVMRVTAGESAAFIITTEGFPDNQGLLLAAFAVIPASVAAPEGATYFDTSVEPFRSYVMHGGAWHANGT